MPILPLNQLSAFSAGADLWVCPDIQNSKWTQELDWHLNHQIRKGVQHRMPSLGPEMKGLLYENQIAWTDVNAPTQDLLISTDIQLPNRWVLVVGWNGQLRKWCQQIVVQWSRMKHPSLRLFLPGGVSTSDLAREWQSLSEHQDLTVVLDKDQK